MTDDDAGCARAQEPGCVVEKSAFGRRTKTKCEDGGEVLMRSWKAAVGEEATVRQSEGGVKVVLSREEVKKVG